jgi:excisionase family DNA binding protein
MPKNTAILTVREAATLTGLSRKTINRLINTGKLPAVNLGERSTRIKGSDLEALVKANRNRLIRQESRGDDAALRQLMSAMKEAPPGADVQEGMLHLWHVEPIGVCGHPFSAHARASDAGHAHACLACDCAGWCGHTVCVTCGASLAESKCKVADWHMWSYRQGRKLHVVSNICVGGTPAVEALYLASEISKGEPGQEEKGA